LGQSRIQILVVLASERDQQLRYYFTLHKDEFLLGEYLIFKRNSILGLVRLLKEARSLQRSLRAARELEVYVANLKVPYTRLLLTQLSWASLNTFDDGIGHLDPCGYFADTNEKRLSRALFSVFAPAMVYERVLEKIVHHYTFFSGPNVYEGYAQKLTQLDLFDIDSLAAHPRPARRRLRVLLTAPYSERGLLPEDVEIGLYRGAIEKCSIEVRLPHPSERESKSANLPCKTVRTLRIAEDHVRRLASFYEIELYSFGSTAALTLAGQPRVKPILLTADCLPKSMVSHLGEPTPFVTIEC
jgi:hypothetical protein